MNVLVAGSAIVLGGAALLLIPWQIPGESLAAINDMRSPAFFPVLAAMIAILAGAALLRPGPAEPAEAAPENPGRTWVLAALVLGSAVLTPVLGGLPVIFVMMAATARVMGERRPLRVLALAGISVLVIHLLFERTLKVLMPPGLLFPGGLAP